MKKQCLLNLIIGIFIISILISCKNKRDYAPTKIGEQEWMTKNLEVSTFSNGDSIPEIKSWEEFEKNYMTNHNAELWEHRSTVMSSEPIKKVDYAPAWCYYNFDKNNADKYGKLYNKAALYDLRGLAPKGWHIPSFDEFVVLRDYLGFDGGGLKLKSKDGWFQDGNGINETGFNAYPGGGLYRNGFNGYFSGIGENGIWMSTGKYSTILGDYSAPPLLLRYKSNKIYLTDRFRDDGVLFGDFQVKTPIFFAIRCVKNK